MKRLAIAIALVMVLAACGTSDELSIETTTPLITDDGNPRGTTTTTETSLVPSLTAALGEKVNGWNEPVDMAVRPGSPATTYVVERGGTIRLMNDDGSPGSVVLTVTDTRPVGEQGLLGLAFSLDGSQAFVNHTNQNGDTVVAALTVEPSGILDPNSSRTLLTIAQPYPNHNGGDLLVSPDGANLFVFTGDGGAGGDPDRHALDRNSMLGKIVRIDLTSPDRPAEVWAVGLRNPWRVSYDATTGLLWIADVGQNQYEEIDRIPLDDTHNVSFGWSAIEGFEPFNTDQDEANAAHTSVDPILVYRDDNGNCSIVGGTVYRGSSIAHAGDWYVFADYCSGRVRALADLGGQAGDVVTIGKVDAPVAVLADARGELWVLSLSGSLTPIVNGR